LLGVVFTFFYAWNSWIDIFFHDFHSTKSTTIEKNNRNFMVKVLFTMSYRFVGLFETMGRWYIVSDNGLSDLLIKLKQPIFQSPNEILSICLSFKQLICRTKFAVCIHFCSWNGWYKQYHVEFIFFGKWKNVQQVEKKVWGLGKIVLHYYYSKSMYELVCSCYTCSSTSCQVWPEQWIMTASKDLSGTWRTKVTTPTLVESH